MPIKTTVKVTGFKEMEKALFQLKNTTARSVVRRAANHALEPVKQAAILKADRRTGALQDSIGIGGRTKPREKKQSDIEVYVGAGRLNGRYIPQAITEEFGTYKQAADPFMRPAWDSQKYIVLARFRQSMATELEKSAARAARKAAREARRIKQGR